jgi:hypothetical protein
MVQKMVRRIVAVLACGLLICGFGCAVAADAFNPSFFAGLGLDPATISPPPGTVIIAFENQTSGVATFFGFESADLDFTVDSRNFSVVAEPGEMRNEVLSCGIDVLSPGQLGENFAISPVAANVQTQEGATDVDYLGPPLVAGSEFVCGDVITVTLTTIGDQFRILVSVTSGR